MTVTTFIQTYYITVTVQQYIITAFKLSYSNSIQTMTVFKYNKYKHLYKIEL